MATAFAVSMDTLFADPNGSVSGVFTPTAGAPVSVRVLFDRHDPEVLSFGDGPSAQHPGQTAEIRTSEVIMQPAEGDTLTVSGTTYRVRHAHQLNDPHGLLWRLDLGR